MKVTTSLSIGLLLVFGSGPAFAQLCTGSLGDPVVNITFDQGSNPGPALPAGTINYNYVGADCPNDGNYAIRNSTTNCYGTWHTLTADHTGGGNGYFLLVNASYDPSDFYVQRVSGLCSSTTYELAAWVLNMVRPSGQILPNLTFSVEKADGTVLATVNSGNIPISATPQWRQYGLFFTTPPGVFDVVLRIRNNAPGGIGNDLALDDITFRPCGPTLGLLPLRGKDTLEVCTGLAVDFPLEAVLPAGAFTAPAIQWQVSTDRGATWTAIPGATGTGYAPAPTGIGSWWYRYTVAENANAGSAACRVASTYKAVVIQTPPTVSAGPDKSVLLGDGVSLEGYIGSAVNSFRWTPPTYLNSTTTLTPVSTPLDSITYVLEAATAAGCTAKDSVTVSLIKGVFIPDAFTPNGDGRNDVWRIPGLGALTNTVATIYNRWGQKVYEGRGDAVRWDGRYGGKEQPAGAYVYWVRWKNGELYAKGTLFLIR